MTGVNKYINIEHSILEDLFHRLIKNKRNISKTIIPDTWKPTDELVKEVEVYLWLNNLSKRYEVSSKG